MKMFSDDTLTVKQPVITATVSVCITVSDRLKPVKSHNSLIKKCLL